MKTNKVSTPISFDNEVKRSSRKLSTSKHSTSTAKKKPSQKSNRKSSTKKSQADLKITQEAARICQQSSLDFSTEFVSQSTPAHDKLQLQHENLKLKSEISKLKMTIREININTMNSNYKNMNSYKQDFGDSQQCFTDQLQVISVNAFEEDDAKSSYLIFANDSQLDDNFESENVTFCSKQDEGHFTLGTPNNRIQQQDKENFVSAKSQTTLRYHSKKAFHNEEQVEGSLKQSQVKSKALLNNSALQNLETILSPSKSCCDINPLLILELEALTFLGNVIPQSEKIEQTIVKNRASKQNSDCKKNNGSKSRFSKSLEGVVQLCESESTSIFNINTPEFSGFNQVSSQNRIQTVPGTEHASETKMDAIHRISQKTNSTQRNSQRSIQITDPKIVEDSYPISFFQNIDNEVTDLIDYKCSNKIIDFITSSKQLSRQPSSPIRYNNILSQKIKEEVPSNEKKNFIQSNIQCLSQEKKRKGLREKHFGSISSQDDIKWIYSKNIMPLSTTNLSRQNMANYKSKRISPKSDKKVSQVQRSSNASRIKNTSCLVKELKKECPTSNVRSNSRDTTRKTSSITALRCPRRGKSAEKQNQTSKIDKLSVPSLIKKKNSQLNQSDFNKVQPPTQLRKEFSQIREEFKKDIPSKGKALAMAGRDLLAVMQIQSSSNVAEEPSSQLYCSIPSTQNTTYHAESKALAFNPTLSTTSRHKKHKSLNGISQIKAITATAVSRASQLKKQGDHLSQSLLQPVLSLNKRVTNMQNQNEQLKYRSTIQNEEINQMLNLRNGCSSNLGITISQQSITPFVQMGNIQSNTTPRYDAKMQTRPYALNSNQKQTTQTVVRGDSRTKRDSSRKDSSTSRMSGRDRKPSLMNYEEMLSKLNNANKHCANCSLLLSKGLSSAFCNLPHK